MIDSNHTPLCLTFDDVLLLPGASDVQPQKVSLGTQLSQNLSLNIPLLSAAMDTVTEYRTAICMAREGGLGILHKNLSIAEQVQQVEWVKRSQSGMISKPITVPQETSLREARQLMEHHHISGLPVTKGKELVGILTNRDLRFQITEEVPISSIMTKGRDKLVTVSPNISAEDAKALLRQHRIEKLLVVNDQYELMGLITYKDIEKMRQYPHACRDSHDRLRVGAALGPGADFLKRGQALLDAGVDVVVMDTAHGHSSRVLKALETFRHHFPDAELIGGNIATAEAAEALIKVGVNAVKVGIGPGSICTTRVVSGVGVPQISAIAAVSKVAQAHNIPVIADGGIKFSGDIVKALAAGAHTVMLGNLLAGTDESPGQLVSYQGRRYKTYRGMGSVEAMQSGSADRYFQDNATEDMKPVAEGVLGRVSYRGSLTETLNNHLGGIRIGMGYIGARTVAEVQTKGQFVRITNAALKEGHVHDIVMVDEAPNYSPVSSL